MKLFHIRDAKYHCKKKRTKKQKKHPTAFNSDALGTNYDKDSSLLQQHFSCNMTSCTEPSTSNLASTGTFLLHQQCQVKCNVTFTSDSAMYSVHVFLCTRYSINKIKILWSSLNFLAFMKAIILYSCRTGAKIVIVHYGRKWEKTQSK